MPADPSRQVPPLQRQTVIARHAQIGYASGNLGKSVVWTTFETLLLFYLVTVAGLSPACAGVLLAGAMAWDGIAGLLLGHGFDRAGGDDRLVQVARIAAPMTGGAFAAIFVVPALDRPDAVMAAVLACVVCRIGYMLCDVAHNTLLLAMTPGGRDAAVVSGYRLMFSAVGATLVGIAARILLALPEGDEQRSAFALAGALGGACYVCFVSLAVAKARRGMVRVSAPRAVRVVSPRDAVAAILGAPTMLRLFALAVCVAGPVPLLVKAIPFAADRADAAGTALLCVTAAQGLAQPLWIAVVDRWLTARQILRIGCWTILAVVLLLTGDGGGGLTAWLFGLAGVAIAGMNMAIWALMSATIQGGRLADAGLRATPVGAFLTILKLAAGTATGAIAGAVSLDGASGGDTLLDLVRFGGPALGAAAALLLMTRMPRPDDPYARPRRRRLRLPWVRHPLRVRIAATRAMRSTSR